VAVEDFGEAMLRGMGASEAQVRGEEPSSVKLQQLIRLATDGAKSRFRSIEAPSRAGTTAGASKAAATLAVAIGASASSGRGTEHGSITDTGTRVEVGVGDETGAASEGSAGESASSM